MKTTVIVPTYNRPAELYLCLKSLSHQVVLPDEVIVADDGSTEETRTLIREFADGAECPFSVKHVWQEDDGFRKPRIINEAVRNASGEYLLFIDGDCMAHPQWLNKHLQDAEPDAMLGGKRVELGEKLSLNLIREKRLLTRFSFELLWDSLIGGTRKAEESLLISPPLLRRIFGLDRISDDGIWGCNFSVSKELFYAINGCDEDFMDGSIEDNDLGIRVINSGGRLKSVRYKANVFHLWHASSWSFSDEKYHHNKRIMTRRIALREPYCLNGIVKRSR